jgi:hypothetical protein
MAETEVPPARVAGGPLSLPATHHVAGLQRLFLSRSHPRRQRSTVPQ